VAGAVAGGGPAEVGKDVEENLEVREVRLFVQGTPLTNRGPSQR
jgi:hypothetical protein